MSLPVLEVCFSPKLLPIYEVKRKIVVVIDVLRATSTICAALANGISKVIPVKDVEDCKVFSGDNYLLAGERHGKKIDGFEYGNSPYEYMNDAIKGKTLVLTTTNGTKSIEISKEADIIVAGAFLNLNILCKWLKKQNKDVLLLCAGWKDKFNMEDSLFAGAVVNKVKNNFNIEFDASIAAEQLYMSAKDDLIGTLKKASHYQRLERMGIEKDMEYCLQLNEADVLPILKDNALVLED